MAKVIQFPNAHEHATRKFTRQLDKCRAAGKTLTDVFNGVDLQKPNRRKGLVKGEPHFINKKAEAAWRRWTELHGA